MHTYYTVHYNNASSLFHDDSRVLLSPICLADALGGVGIRCVNTFPAFAAGITLRHHRVAHCHTSNTCRQSGSLFTQLCGSLERKESHS